MENVKVIKEKYSFEFDKNTNVWFFLFFLSIFT